LPRPFHLNRYEVKKIENKQEKWGRGLGHVDPRL